MAKYRGTDVVWGRATTSAFTTPVTIPNVREVTPGLGGTNATFDQSAYGDTWMDFGAGQKEGNEITITMQYDPAQATHTSLRTDADSAATMYLVATHAASTKHWNVTLTGTGSSINPDRTGSLELQVTAKIVSPGVVEV